MSPIPDDELISAYLDDELSREERLRAEQLLLDRADLRRLFDELRGLRQGLRSLPKFSLGDEFSSAVLRQAERSVLQGDDADTTKSPAADSAAAPIAPDIPTAPGAINTPAFPAAAAQASQQQQGHDARPTVLPDHSRALRPIVYVLTTVAAAMAIMFYQQGIFDRHEVAMKPQPLDKAGKEGPVMRAPSPTHVAEGTAALRSKNGVTLGDSAAISSIPSTESNIAPGPDATNSAKMADARGPAATDAGAGAGQLFRVDNAFASKSATSPTASPTPPLTVPTPTIQLGIAQQVDAAPALGDAADPLVSVALGDRRRLDSLAWNAPKAQRADGTVNALQLQQLAAVDPQPQGGLAAGDVAADATQRKQIHGYGNELQLRNGSGNGNGLLVVTGKADPDTIEKFTKVLEEQRVDDFSKVADIALANGTGGNGWSGGGRVMQKEGRSNKSFGQAATESERDRVSQRELASRGRAAGDTSGGAGGGAGNRAQPAEPDGKVAAGPAGRAGVNGQPGASIAKTEGIRREAGEKGDAKSESDDAGEEYDYVYIVATEDQMKAILKTVRGDTKFYDIAVEATPEVYATNRWRELGLANQVADLKRQAPASAIAGATAGGSGPLNKPAAKAVGQSEPIAPSPAGAAKPTSTPAPTTVATTPAATMPTANAPTGAAPLAAATALKPKATAPALNAVAGAAAAPAAPAASQPPASTYTAAPQAPAAQAPASPPAAGASPSGLMVASQPNGRPAADQPIAKGAPSENNERHVESQGYSDQQQRRGYSGYSQSRWQRSNDRQLYERVLSEQQLAADRSNSFAVTNPIAEKSQADKSLDARNKEAGKLNETAKKSEDAPAGRSSGVKSPAETPLVANDSELKRMPLDGLGSPPAPKQASQSGADPSSFAPAKPKDPADPAARSAQFAKDEADTRRRDTQAIGVGPAGNASIGGAAGGGVAGGGFVPAPPMLPTQQPIAPTQQAAPEEVLGKIAGTQQPPPLVQQAMPALAPNRIRGVAQEEQAAAQNSFYYGGEVPPEYQEALFVFRVVKPKGSAKPLSGEADSKPQTTPAKQ